MAEVRPHHAHIHQLPACQQDGAAANRGGWRHPRCAWLCLDSRQLNGVPVRDAYLMWVNRTPGISVVLQRRCSLSGYRCWGAPPLRALHAHARAQQQQERLQLDSELDDAIVSLREALILVLGIIENLSQSAAQGESQGGRSKARASHCTCMRAPLPLRACTQAQQEHERHGRLLYGGCGKACVSPARSRCQRRRVRWGGCWVCGCCSTG